MALEYKKGRLTFATGKVVADITNDDLALVVNEISKENAANEFGLSMVKKKMGAINQAVSDPAAYSKAVIKALEELEKEVNENYRENFATYMELGYSKSEAKKLAMDYARAIYNMKMAQLNVKFPGDVVANAMKATGKVTGAKLGILAP